MSLAVITKPIAPSIGPTWQATSVQQYFTQINWQGPTAESSPSSPTQPRSEMPTGAPSRALSNDMSVGQFFAHFPWSKRQPPTPSSSEPSSSSQPQSSRPAHASLLDLELLEQVFLPEGKGGQDISIGDFSDFF